MITAYKIVKYVDSELADAVSLEIGSMKLNIRRWQQLSVSHKAELSD